MSNSYTIQNTDGSKTITILAGTVSGNSTNAVTKDTDLLLYGRGSFNWGAGIEQNLIRLTENWASPAENPNAAINSQYPKIYADDSNKGISKPLIGQTWFNKSNNRTYINIDGLNVSGSWKLDAEGRYLSTSSGGVVAANVGVEGNNPILTIRSTTNNFGGSPSLKLDGTDLSGTQVTTAEIRYGNTDDVLQLNKFSKADDSVIDNSIIIRETFTEMTQIVRGIDTIDNHPDNTLTTKGFVTDKIEEAPYLPLSGGTVDGNVVITNSNQVAASRLTILASQPTSSNPSGVEFGINLADHDATKTAIKILQGAFNNTAIPSAANLSDNQDTFAIEKYDGLGNTLNAMYMLDAHIETHGARGKIRTPATNMNSDDARTLITLDSAKNYFQQDGENILIDKDTEATIVMKSPVGNYIRLDAESGSTLGSRLDFVAGGTLKGKIALRENFPNTGDETLVMQKYVGATLNNTLEVHDDETYSSKKIRLGSNDGNGNLILRAENNNIIDTTSSTDSSGNIISFFGNGDDHYHGIVFKNSNNFHTASILSSNSNSLRLRAGDQGGTINLSDTAIFIGNQRLRGIGSGAVPDSSNQTISSSSEWYAQESQLYKRTNKLEQQQFVTGQTFYIQNTSTDGFWYDYFGSGQPDNSDVFGQYSDYVEFDFTDADEDWFSQSFSSTPSSNFKEFRIKLDFNFSCFLGRTSNSSTGFYSFTVALQYRSASTLSVPDHYSDVGWIDISSRADMVATGIQQQTASVVGNLRLPIGANEKIQIRFPRNCGLVRNTGSSLYNDFERVSIPFVYYTARIV